MRRFMSVLLTAAIVLAPATLGQEPSESFRDQVEVEVVNVDVTVTDRDGKAVRNLSREDFRLTVDGKKVNFPYFDAPEEESGPQELVVLLVDNRHLNPQMKVEALTELEAPLLALARAGCNVKIATYGGVLQVLQPFTMDETEIRTGLARAQRAGNTASQLMWKERQVATDYVISNLRSFSRNPPKELVDQTHKAVLSQLRDFAQYENEDALDLLETMSLMLASLGGVAGHKTVILLSDGFALQPVDKVFDRFARSEKRLSQTDPTTVRAPENTRFTQRSGIGESVVPGGASEWRKGYEDLNIVDDVFGLGRLANTAGVTIHTVPLTPSFLDEVERAAQVELGQERFVISDLDYSLKMIAESSGGRTHDRAGDLGAFLERAVEEIPSSYSLGFVPTGDGEYHELKVKVRGKGLRLRHRPGYVARSWDQKFAARTIAAVTLDMVDNPHNLGIQIQEMKPLDDGMNEVSIVAVVPISDLDLTSDGANHFADLWAAGTYLDANGQVGDLQTVAAPLTIPTEALEEALEQDFGAVIHLRMPAGSQPTAIGLWNRTTGSGSFISGNIDVQPPPPAEGS